MRTTLCFVSIILVAASCGISKLRDQQAILQRLVATNAPLSVVEAQIGHIPIRQRGSKEWSDFRAFSTQRTDPKSKQILEKIDKSAGVGFASTISMQTYIFVDEQNKLIDFEVDSQ